MFFQEAIESVPLAWLSGLTTIGFMITFIGWAWWAYAPQNRKMMDEAAMMPLDEETDPNV